MQVCGILLLVAAATSQWVEPMGYEYESDTEITLRYSNKRYASIEIDVVDEYSLHPKSSCQGLLLSRWWILTTSDCMQEQNIFYVRTIAGTIVEEYNKAAEVHRTERINSPFVYDFSVVQATRQLTYAEYNYLYFGWFFPSEDFGNLKTAMSKKCRGMSRGEFEEEVRQAVGVPYSICDQIWPLRRKWSKRMSENITET